METLTELTQRIENLVNQSSVFIVITRENNYQNTGDANYSEDIEFTTLPEAYQFYLDQCTDTFETQSEFKEVELILNDENDIFEVLLSETYVAQYKEEDYGKFILHYLPKNNGIAVSKIETLNAKTPYYVNQDKKFTMTSEMFDTKEDVIQAIYNYSLYISMDEAEELFEEFLE
ncbi:hypothetical protein Q361_11732 [Flavobacterium croceum DSM 17960]|uniref:Uncharacterized protein n=1 Tax=Flavobacterium croceum DSM 17960 TaxID=1121886 RepID=A0A2S4N5C4_9FLAO|nr:hypothetical protein [Flavobacterium croceum]POS00928.1 hypothetical protein Q361_11732 [Flavobacterium croceum DSM 17960]